MIETLVLLLSASVPASRGVVLVPHSTSERSTVVVGTDTLHLNFSATLGSCAYTEHHVEEFRLPFDTSLVDPFPGDATKPSGRGFARIDWSNWSAISPGATCLTRVVQDPGGLRFRFRKSGDVLVLMDTVFFRIADTHSVAGYPYRLVTGVQSRWSHAPYEAKQKWVRWVDTLDFISGKTFAHANHPLITLTDSMPIDSIVPALPRVKRDWNLHIDAVERSGKAWTFETHGWPGPPSPGNRGAGVRLPPGTTFRFQEYSEEGAEANPEGKRIRVLHIWSKGKVIDSLFARPTGIIVEKVLRKRAPVPTSPVARSFDALGRRDPGAPPTTSGPSLFPTTNGIEIRFGN